MRILTKAKNPNDLDASLLKKSKLQKKQKKLKKLPMIKSYNPKLKSQLLNLLNISSDGIIRYVLHHNKLTGNKGAKKKTFKKKKKGKKKKSKTKKRL